jgi:hypothetical protein
MTMTYNLRDTLGGITCPEVMHGDNLAIVLCTAFDDSGPTDEETGWSVSAIEGCNATLSAIHAHYAPRIAALEAALKPFAKFADPAGEVWNTTCLVSGIRNGKIVSITMGDCYRARAALVKP